MEDSFIIAGEEIFKLCSKCCVYHNVSSFNRLKNRSLSSWCKLCYKQYYHDNDKRILNNKKEYYNKSSGKILSCKRTYYIDNVEKIKSNRSEYFHKNKRMIYNKRKELYTSDNLYKLTYLIRIRIINGIKSNKRMTKKSNATRELLCCDWILAKTHLERQFRDGMTWKNHGKVWHIDHIIPISFFDLSNLTEQKLAFHYGNLQPLLVKENLEKSDNIPVKTNFTYFD